MSSTARKATRVRIADAGDSIRRREAFIAGDGSLTGGYPTDATDVRSGRLHDSAWLGRFADARRIHQTALYVVRSYGTPIAWAGPGESLTVPAVTYSVTTSRHQGIARRADDARPEDMSATERRIMRAMIRQEHGAE